MLAWWRSVIRDALGGSRARDALGGRPMPESAINFASGFLAGASEAMVWTTPTDRLKTLRQAEAGMAAG